MSARQALCRRISGKRGRPERAASSLTPTILADTLAETNPFDQAFNELMVGKRLSISRFSPLSAIESNVTTKSGSASIGFRCPVAQI
jgi:hypothetical protein